MSASNVSVQSGVVAVVDGRDVEAEVVAAALAGFGLSAPTQPPRVLPDGLMNRNWRVCTAEGVWAVKQVVDVDARAARRQHRVTTVLAGLGLPVPAPVVAPDGDTLVELDGVGVFAVLPWVEGTHRDGWALTEPECARLGGLLARIHQGLAGDGLAGVLDPAPAAQLVAVTDMGKALAKVDYYQRLVDVRTDPDAFDELARQRLAERRDLLTRFADRRPDDTVAVAPIGWTHGDFHDLNLLWSADQPARVTAVLDWDRLRQGPLAAELVRTATLMFGYETTPQLRALDLARVAAFTDGYRQHLPLPDAALADAAHRLWWERLCDFWQLKWHYDKTDTSCDHLFVSASALLAWWSAHRDEVTSAFTTA